jgi:hypothetical protein
MVRHVVRLAEDGAQAEVVGQVRGEPSHAPAADSDQRAACGRGDTRSGGRTPCPADRWGAAHTLTSR